MSVDNVQGKFLTPLEIGQLPTEDRERYVAAKGKEKKALTIEFRQRAGKTPDEPLVTGTAVEQGVKAPADPETMSRKAQAKAKAEQEAAEAKKFADSLYKPQELSEHERQLADEALQDAGVQKPLYKSRKAQRELRQNLKEQTYKAFENSQAYKDAIAGAKTDAERKAITKLYENLAEKGSRVMSRDITRGDKIEHTRMFDSRAEKWDAKDNLGDEKNGLRLRVHTAKTRNADDSVIKTKMDANEGMTMHESVMDSAKGMSGDRYFEPNEYKNFSTEIDSRRSPVGSAKRELQKAGYGVKDDTLKNIGKGLAVGVLSQLGTGSIGLAVEAVAEAIVQNTITGEVLAYDKQEANYTYRNWKGMGIGAGVGTIAAAALFGKTQDEDVLHGKGVDEIFTNIPGTETRAYEKLSFGSEDETLRVRTVMRAIDELDLTDAEKTQFLREAAGDKGQHILSKKELVQAFVNAYESIPDTAPVEDSPKVEQKPATEKPQVKEEQPPVEEPPTVEQTPKDEQPPVTEKTPVTVTVLNGESFSKIAKKYGITVEQLLELNGDKIHKFKDCNGKVHKFFRAGETITLPDTANTEAVEANKSTTSKTEAEKYRKAVTSETSVKKFADDDCEPKLKAAGPEVEKLVKEYRYNKSMDEAIASANERLANLGVTVDPKELEGKTKEDQIIILAEKEIEAQKAKEAAELAAKEAAELAAKEAAAKVKKEIAEIEARLENAKTPYDNTADLARYKELTGKDYQLPKTEFKAFTSSDIPYFNSFD